MNEVNVKSVCVNIYIIYAKQCLSTDLQYALAVEDFVAALVWTERLNFLKLR